MSKCVSTKHKRYVASILFVLVLAFVSMACTNGWEPTVAPTLEPTATPGTQPISIVGPACPDNFQEDQAQSISKDVEISVNRSFTLTLGSTPSIPCGWHSPEIDDQAIVRQVDHQSKWPAEGMTPMPGAPGTEIWIFETLIEGDTSISLNCVCLSEEGSEEEISGTFTLNVTAKK
jgi:predicted secreted protein